MTKSLAPGQTIALPTPPPGWFDLDYSVTPNGELALVRCDRDYFGEYRAWYKQSSAVPLENLKRGKTPPPRPGLTGARLRLSRFDGRIESSPIEVLPDRWAKVASLPDGSWLVNKGGRFQRYTGAGEAAGSLDLGECVQDLRVTRGGTIWVGYFDEGVFAHAGPDGRVPVSTSGIARFSPEGLLLWRLNWRDELSIWDCYSLTIEGERVWSCPYGDPNFPIVLIEDDSVRFWRNDLIGVKALAADGEHVLLGGGYEQDSNRIALLRLEGENTTLLREWRFEPPPRHAAQLLQGMGSTLHLVQNRKWSRFEVRAMLGAAGKGAA